MIGRCLTCGKQLRGKQRYFCSPACDKRYRRLMQKYPDLFIAPGDNRVSMSEIRPTIDQIVRQSGENVRETSEIIVLIRVNYKNSGVEQTGFANNSSPDTWRLNTMLHADLAKFLLKWLKSAFPEWEIGRPKIDIRKT